MKLHSSTLEEHFLGMISKPTNTHKCIKVYYAHHTPPTSSGHSCGHLQGCALQRKDTWKYYRSFWTHTKKQNV